MADVDDRWFRVVDGVKVKTSRHGIGKRWAARWRDESGKQRSKSFERKIDAERHLATVAADTLRGTYVDPSAGKVTFREYAEQWRTSQVHRDTTRAQVETRLRLHVYSAFGTRPIGSIRPSDVQAWVRGLSTATEGRNALAPATIQVAYRYVTSVFLAAVADRVIPSSPCVNVTLPKISPKRVEPPAGEVIAALYDAIEDRFRMLITLGVGTGVRQGEAFGIELDCLDFDRRTLEVRQQITTMPGTPPYLAPPKTEKSYRVIPLSPSVIDALEKHLADYPPVPVEIEDRTGIRPVRRMAHLVFTSPQGRPLTRTRFSERFWRPARQKAGAPETLTYHDLRHYFASALIRFGESVKTVQARLGHASATETLDTYGHLWPDSEDRTRQAVEDALSKDVRRMCAEVTQ